LLGGFSLRDEGAKGVALATLSTLLVLGLLVLAATRSAYWPQFKDQFLNRQVFAATFPGILRAFKRLYDDVPDAPESTARVEPERTGMAA